MKKLIVICLLSFAGAPLALALDPSGLIKAQVVLGQVTQVVEKYQEIQAMLDAGTIELKVTPPMDSADGKYVLPFDAEGQATEWAAKALEAQVGSEVGKQVGSKAAGMLATKVPFGSAFGGLAEKKSKELGSVIAIGGWDYIRETSSLSFNDLYDYSVYLHSQYNGLPGYEEALASAMAVYPDLEKSHEASVDRAYKEAKKEAQALAKAEAKRLKAEEKAAKAAEKEAAKEKN